MTLTEEADLVVQITGLLPNGDPIYIYWRDHARQQWRKHRDQCSTCKPWADGYDSHPPACTEGHELLTKWCNFYGWKLDYSLNTRGFVY